MTDSSQLPVLVSPPTPLPFWRRARFWITLAALILIGWQWWATQRQLAEARQHLTTRAAENDLRAREAEARLDKALAETKALEAKYAALAARQAEFQGEADALRQIYQEANLNREDALLADIEQNLHLAVQQLQLAGNVQAAIQILGGIDARLAHVDNLLFTPLRSALAHDLKQLRATPFVDVVGMSLALENVMTSVDQLPLAMPIMTPVPKPPETSAASASWWRHLANETWRDLKSMVRIQRFDRHEPVLLGVDQALILRANLKLRLLNARLALLSRDYGIFRSEVATARQWLQDYFNTRDAKAKAVDATLQQLAAAEMRTEPYDLNDSLIALKTLKAKREGS